MTDYCAVAGKAAARHSPLPYTFGSTFCFKTKGGKRKKKRFYNFKNAQ